MPLTGYLQRNSSSTSSHNQSCDHDTSGASTGSDLFTTHSTSLNTTLTSTPAVLSNPVNTTISTIDFIKTEPMEGEKTPHKPVTISTLSTPHHVNSSSVNNNQASLLSPPNISFMGNPVTPQKSPIRGLPFSPSAFLNSPDVRDGKASNLTSTPLCKSQHILTPIRGIQPTPNLLLTKEQARQAE